MAEYERLDQILQSALDMAATLMESVQRGEMSAEDAAKALRVTVRLETS